jgi:hypothetical protein
MRGSKPRPESKQNVGDLIMRLFGTCSISRHGSYDSEGRCFVPYFLAEDGSRHIFGAAARHYGEIALRKRLPEANVAKLREVLSWPLECLRGRQDAAKRRW